jgi:hippurate hydrolase
MNVPEKIKAYHDDLTAWRRDIHAHPELGFDEHRTSDFVAKKLGEFGITVHRSVGKTGVVGVLQTGNGPTIGLRCDMDALPIDEIVEVPYKSTKPGVMHACGHDGHTTMLLGAARYLAETKNFDGTVYFIFQPAEEGIGGALAMLEDRLFERFPCDSVFGMHNNPGLPVGKFAIRPGAMMAGGGFFDIDIKGRGSHGARPEESVDPVLVASHIVTSLQAIISRNITPLATAVVSCTAIRSGDAYNVIPQTASIKGTVRTFSHDIMAQIENAMRRTAESTAQAFGATATLNFAVKFAPLVNDDKETTFIADCAAGLVGEADVERNRGPIMASEDFSYMLEKCKGAYINIGNGGPGTPTSVPVHNPAYQFNDEILPLGSALYARLVEAKLGRLGS